jgi:hypothetical protein
MKATDRTHRKQIETVLNGTNHANDTPFRFEIEDPSWTNIAGPPPN